MSFRVPSVAKPSPAAPARKMQMRYLRDTGSGVLARRPAPLIDNRDATRQAWTRAAGLASDIIRNSGRLRGAVDQVIADTVGHELVLNPRPDLERLGYSKAEIAAWCSIVKRRWKQYAWTPAECDLRGKRTLPELVDIALRHFIVYGEVLALHEFMPWPDRRRYGIQTGAKLCLITPSRLMQDTRETERLFQGVYHDELGRVLGYQIKRPGVMAWGHDVYPARDQDGRALVTHLFDAQDADDVRGISQLAPAWRKHLQHEMLEDATLQVALLQTLFAVTLTSDRPTLDAFEAIESFADSEAGAEFKSAYAGYFTAQMERAAESTVRVGTDPGISHMAPGEKLSFETPQVPGSDYEPFSASLSRDMARALGVTYGALTMNYEAATYSSVRMENATIWPVVTRRRERIAGPLCQAAYEPWLEEEIATGRIPLRGGHAAFLANRASITWALWQGPAKPTADDLKSAKATSQRLENGTSSLARETSDLGFDADEIFEERLAEHNRYVDAGMMSPYERNRARSDGVDPPLEPQA